MNNEIETNETSGELEHSFSFWPLRSANLPTSEWLYENAKCHNCGAKTYDLNRKRRIDIRKECKYKTCVQHFTTCCNRWNGGWGRIFCPCEEKRHGHGTYHEFASPSGKKKLASQRKWKKLK